MDFAALLLVLALLLSSLSISSPSKPFSLNTGSSLSVEKKDDILISPNGIFTAGFYSVGSNAYCFAIWFTEPLHDGELTIAWMANRDMSVNGKQSELSLLKTGNLVLKDANQQLPVWTTDTRDSTASAQLQLNDTGNLFLQNSAGQILWQSFDSPTDTLLPYQVLTRSSSLVSSRSLTNFSSGFYKLYFDNDNVLRLVYNGPVITSVYWPDPLLRAWDAGRSNFMTERTAKFNSSGYFRSTDALSFYPSDAGEGPQRRMTVDIDGNVRVYSLDRMSKKWQVSWQGISEPCMIHGICGANSTCSYDPKSGRRCSCLPRHKMIDPTDWSLGCEPEFNVTLCGNGEDEFVHFPHVEFFGFDAVFLPNYTLDGCKRACLKVCNCKGIKYEYDNSKGLYLCYVKFRLFSGYHSFGLNSSMYIKLPRNNLSSLNYDKPFPRINLSCSAGESIIELERVYEKKEENASLKFMLLFTYAFGGLEIICILYFFYRIRHNSGKTIQLGYLQAASGFKRFSYAELRKATGNFSNEIGRGGNAVVYKGVLSDNRVVAIKRLKEATSPHQQGEAEFLAEASIIGRLNHMNLIEIWGYCVDGKHRLLVYEYMENGSLAEKLNSNNLDWEKRLGIAVGTAKGLAYLHEECLEWVLHCDVKPHNILLDCDHKPKVADFGLSKLLDRGGGGNSGFTRARGTRGYMAPEWVFINLPITSKVDVYSYGVVMLEMITGRSPTGAAAGDDNGGTSEPRRLVTWVREKMTQGAETASWIHDIVDPKMDAKFDIGMMKTLIKVALQCADEDRDARPNMSQVVDMLLHPENENDD